MTSIEKFKKIVWDYFKTYKRDLPWRNTDDPYKILISEVMLQQTQVSRIIPKYESFLKVFPDFYTLASADLSDLLREWKGIGYNRRAMYLKNVARIVVEKYNGILPDDPKILETFPGIGYSTASSITVYAFNKPIPFIETNIRRIYIHHFFKDKESVHDKEIMPIVEKTLEKKDPRTWYWALMDYGTYLAKTIPNPNKKSKHYVKQSQFEGSTRQLRAKVLHYVVEVKKVTKKQLHEMIEDDRLDDVLLGLVNEGFLQKKGTTYSVK